MGAYLKEGGGDNVSKPVKVAFDCQPDLYERFRRIYPGHGDVSRFFRKIVRRTVSRVEERGTDGLGRAVLDIADKLVDDDIDKGRIL